MKYCVHCGKELLDDAVICLQCGCSVENEKTKGSSGLLTAAKVFMIIGCIFNAFFYLVPLLWTIPMTVNLFKKAKSGEKMGTGFKVCTLLFVNMIAGILLLCHNDD